MSMPKLKRIRVTSLSALRHWLAQNMQDSQSVMLVTHCEVAHDHYVSREDLGQALAVHGWTVRRRYTLSPHLLGHVIVR